MEVKMGKKNPELDERIKATVEEVIEFMIEVGKQDIPETMADKALELYPDHEAAAKRLMGLFHLFANKGRGTKSVNAMLAAQIVEARFKASREED